MSDFSIDLGYMTKNGSVNNRLLTIYNSSLEESTLDFAIESDSSWLSAVPSAGEDVSGDTDGVEIVISANVTDLNDGESYNGTLTVTDSGATNSPYEIDVSLEMVA